MNQRKKQESLRTLLKEKEINKSKDLILKYRTFIFSQPIQKKVKSNSLDVSYVNKKEVNPFKMMNQMELNEILYKLKNFYNEIEKENEKKTIKINEIKKKNKEIENKIKNVEKGKEIESEKEKINGLEEVNNLNYIIDKIKKLDNKFKNGKKEVINEEEYTTTLKYLIEDQKNKIITIDEETINVNQKIHDLKQIRKDLEHNNLKTFNQILSMQKIDNFFENDLKIINNIIMEQEIKKSKIDFNNLEKEKKINQLKEKYNKNKEFSTLKYNIYKNEMMEKINIYNYQKEKKSQKEEEIINFIIGLYFFQKYCMNKNKENINDKEEIINNNYKLDSDFLNFMNGQQYIFSNSDNENLNDELEKNEKNKLKKNKSHCILKRNKISSYSLNFNNSQIQISKPKPKKIKLNEIIEKFNYIDLNFNDIYDFYSKIVSLANFRRKKMSELNKRIINLETQKQIYQSKVTEIINKDYKNINDLINENSRFQQFYEEYKLIINKSINKREENFSKTLIELYNRNKVNPDSNTLKKKSKFIEKCNNGKRKIILIYESLIDSMQNLNDFKLYDDNNLNENEEKSSEKIIEMTINFVNKYKEIKTEDYIKDILEYSIEKNIKYSKEIYNILFLKEKKNKDNYKYMKANLIDEIFIFYLFKETDNQIKLIKLLKNISDFYSDIFYNEKNNEKLENLKISIKNLINNLNDNSLKIKNKKKQILFTKTKEDEMIKRKKSFSNPILNEYNYVITTEDSENYNKISKLIRPKTSQIPICKKIVKQLYEPSLKKNKYLRELKSTSYLFNSDLKLRRSNSKILKRKWYEIEDLEKQFFLFNNRSKILFLFFFRY